MVSVRIKMNTRFAYLIVLKKELRATHKAPSWMAHSLLLQELHLLGGDEGESGTTGHDLLTNVLSQLGSVALEAFSLGTSTGGEGTHADNSSVDGAGHAVLLLDVDSGQVEVLSVVSKVVFDVSLGGTIDHVSHLESLDSLVLGDDSTAVDAAHDVGVSLVLLSSSVVSSLRWHILINNGKQIFTAFKHSLLL